MGEETKIIMPTKNIDKEKLTEEEKTALLSSAFKMEDHHSELPMAVDHVVEPFADVDAKLLNPIRPGNGPEVTSAPLVRGKMLGEAQGMKPRRPLEAHAAALTDDASLDNVPPMLRAKVLAERKKAAGG
jgi:hypothetical protein